VTLILSLQHELTSKGIRVQVVLPGRTATDGWDVAGFPWQKMPPEIVMPVEDMVDAALVGLDQGELVTIPGLQNVATVRHFCPRAPLQESSAKVSITGEKCARREYNTRSRVLCAVVG
jgi:short-subunit dehydrogenase